jgi:beta-xylosidase
VHQGGDGCRVTFRLAAEQLAFTGVDGRLIIEPGRHRVMLGTSSADLPLAAEFEVIGDVRRLPARSRFFSLVEVSEPR